MLQNFKNVYSLARNKGSAGITILFILAVTAIILGLLIWFFCCCHGWLVLAFPTFVAFPKWAFVLLMFILSGGSRGGSSS